MFFLVFVKKMGKPLFTKVAFFLTYHLDTKKAPSARYNLLYVTICCGAVMGVW